MSVYKDIDIEMQDLLLTVRSVRNASQNAPTADVDREETEIDMRHEIFSRLLRAGWIAPTYTSTMRMHLQAGNVIDAVTLLADVLAVDLLDSLEPLKRERAKALELV